MRRVAVADVLGAPWTAAEGNLCETVRLLVASLLQAQHVFHLIALHCPDSHQGFADSFFHGRDHDSRSGRKRQKSR